jgi:hypothetical protein
MNGKGLRGRIVARRLRSRKLRVVFDSIDIFLLFLVLCVAPPRAKEWKQGVQAFITMAGLSAIGLFLVSRERDATAIAGFGVAVAIVLIAAAFIRVAAIVDTAIDNKFAGIAGPEQPDVPDYSFTVVVVVAFLLTGIPIGLVAMDRMGQLSLFGTEPGIPWVPAFITTVDQLFRGALLYVFDHYDFGLDAPKPLVSFDKRVVSGIRLIFALLFVAAILRLASFRPRRRQMRAAIAALMKTPEYAVRLGRRMAPMLRRFIRSRPKSSYFRELIARDNAVAALAAIEGEAALPILREAVKVEFLRGGALRGLMEIESIESLKLLLVAQSAWESIATKDQQDFWMGLGRFSEVVRRKGDAELVEELVAHCYNESLPPKIRTGLHLLLALAGSRYQVRPFSSEDPIEWQAREVGFGVSFPRNFQANPHPLLHPSVRRLFLDVLSQSDDGLDQFIALCGLDWLQIPELAPQYEQLIQKGNNPMVRARAMIALGRCGSRQGLHAIIDGFEMLSLNAERYIAANALMTAGGEAAEDFLLTLLERAFSGDQRYRHLIGTEDPHSKGISYELVNPIVAWLAQSSEASRKRLLNWSFDVEDEWMKRLAARTCLGAQPELALTDGRRLFQSPVLSLVVEAVGAVTQTPAVLEELQTDVSVALQASRSAIQNAKAALVPTGRRDDPQAQYRLTEARRTARQFIDSLGELQLAQSTEEQLRLLKEALATTAGIVADDDDSSWGAAPTMELLGRGFVETDSGMAETIGSDVNWKLLFLTGGARIA